MESPCGSCLIYQVLNHEEVVITRFGCGCKTVVAFGKLLVEKCTDDLRSWDSRTAKVITMIPKEIGDLWLAKSSKKLLKGTCTPLVVDFEHKDTEIGGPYIAMDQLCRYYLITL